jgi:phage-related protein
LKRFELEFYEDEHGKSPVSDWLRELDFAHGKESRSMLRKVYFQFERLEHEGPGIGEPIVKRIEDGLWELRSIPNRVFFAMMRGNRIVLLHAFRKKSMKTPEREIEKARREYRDWIDRGGIA